MDFLHHKSEGLLTLDQLSDMNAILKSSGDGMQVNKLYEILASRSNAYDVLLNALFGIKYIRPGNILTDVHKRDSSNFEGKSQLPDAKYVHTAFSEASSESSIGQEVTAGARGMIDVVLNCPYDSSYEVAKESIKIAFDQILGSGMFGCVYKAVLLKRGRSVDVALKMTRSNAPVNAFQDLMSEIKILTYLGKHPNIVSLMGTYTVDQSNGVVYLATELCSLGSLEVYLRNSEVNKVTDEQFVEAGYVEVMENISFSDMVKWSREIASGMEFLGTKHVVHADLATRNVLLSYERTAKISDFGLSRRMHNYKNYVKTKQGPIPWKWMAIESLRRHEYSAKSDVWSFGVTLWEIFSMGDIPYPCQSLESGFINKLVHGLRLQCPKYSPNGIYEIMKACWFMNPQKRPTFGALKQQLSSISECYINWHHVPVE